MPLYSSSVGLASLAKVSDACIVLTRVYVVDAVIAGVTPSVSSHTAPVSVHADHVAVNVLAVPS